MKKLFVLALAAFAMVACVNEDIVETPKGNEISFEDAFVDNATRVGYTKSNLGAFDVWGWVTSTNGTVNIFNNTDVTKGTDGVWSYTGTKQYWFPGNAYLFEAVAPMNDEHVVVTAAADKLATVAFTNANGTEDLIYAVETIANVTENQGAVAFTFNHLLSKVMFNFTDEFDGVDVVVKDVTMKVPATATYTFGEGWGAVAGETTLDFNTDTELLTIPAGASQAYVINFTVEVSMNGNTLYTKPLSSTVTGKAFEAGHAYKFSAAITPEILNLKEIEFTVAEVDGWVPAEGEEVKLPKAYIGNTGYESVEEAWDEAESDDVITLNANATVDADVTLKVAGKTLTLDLKGYTLKGASDQTGSNRNMFDVSGGTLTVKNGAIVYEHKGADMAWNSSTNLFNVTAGGVLNLEGVTAKNLGGSAMAFVAHLNNWGEATLNVNNSTLESTYIAVRAFNSGYDMNNITFLNTTLKGKYCFWVHNYKPAGDSSGTDATLNLNIYDESNNNTYIYTGYAPVMFGFNNPIYYDAHGFEVIAAGVAVDDTTNPTEYNVSNEQGFDWFVNEVNVEGANFAGKTVTLVNDLDLAALANGPLAAQATEGEFKSNWTPIGTSENPFKGTFDGKGKTIKNLKINGGSNSNIGFFGYTTDGEIKNLTFENAKVSGRLNVGVVAGTPYTSKYTNITVKGHVEVDGMAYVGAVGGKNAYADWTNITVEVDETSYVNANSVENGNAYRTYVGGVIGFMGEGGHTVKNVTSNINVKGSTCDVGGVVGIAHYGNKFENITCTGNVEIYAASEEAEAQEIGGIAGVWHNETGTTVTFTNCKFNGEIKANDGYVINTDKFGNLVCSAYNTTGKGVLNIDGNTYVQYEYGVVINGDTYTVDSGDALVDALTNKKNVSLMNDIKIDPAKMSNAYGKTGILVYYGQTIDGNNHKLDVKGAGGTWDSGICTSGGLIKDLWVTGAFRGVFVKGADHTEKIVLENVRIEGTTYTISIDQASYQGLEATNSIFRGWTSYAGTIGNVKFTGCTFGAGSGYNFSRPYAPTEYVNCTFEAGHQIDPRAEVTFENCTFNGVALTAENLSTLVTSNIANASVK